MLRPAIAAFGALLQRVNDYATPSMIRGDSHALSILDRFLLFTP